MAELAKHMNETEQQIKEWQLIVKDPISIDQRLNEDDDATLGDLVADEDEESPIEELHHHQVTKTIAEVLATLDEREADIISRRFGLDNQKAQTLEDIGKVYGLSKERIRQIEDKAMRKLRNPMRAGMLRECLEC